MLPAAARFAPGSDKRQAQRGAEAPLLRTVPERKAVPAAPVETPDQAQASLRPLPLHMTGLRKRRPELLGQGPHPAAHPPRQVPAMPDPAALDAGPSAAEGLSCGSAERPMSCFSSAASACPAAA